MTIFLSGGAKNGKSMLAQRLSKALAGGGRLYYAATMIPHDGEDDARIARHRREREGWGFETVECPLEPHRAMEGRPRGTVLFDSVTALLANEMFSARGIDSAAPERAKQSLLRLADWAEHIVFVSDFIYSWCVVIPLKLLAAFVFKWPFWAIVICCHIDQFLKVFTVSLKVYSYTWIKKLAS